MTSESSTSILGIPRPIDANNDDNDTSLNKVFTNSKKRGRGLLNDNFAIYSNHWMNQILEYNDILEPDELTSLQPAMPSTSNNIEEVVENSILLVIQTK